VNATRRVSRGRRRWRRCVMAAQWHIGDRRQALHRAWVLEEGVGKLAAIVELDPVLYCPQHPRLVSVVVDLGCVLLVSGACPGR
jgi:hypothetical protein